MLSKSLCGCHLLELSYMYILHHLATLLNKLHRTGSFWAADDSSVEACVEAQIVPCKRITGKIMHGALGVHKTLYFGCFWMCLRLSAKNLRFF